MSWASESECRILMFKLHMGCNPDYGFVNLMDRRAIFRHIVETTAIFKNILDRAILRMDTESYVGIILCPLFLAGSRWEAAHEDIAGRACKGHMEPHEGSLIDYCPLSRAPFQVPCSFWRECIHAGRPSGPTCQINIPRSSEWIERSP